jgi:hypothetical protein
MVHATVSETATVLWFNGLSKLRRAQILRQVRAAKFRVFIVVSYGVRSRVVTAWAQLKLVKFYPLASTYHCAIAEDAWRACLDRLGIDSKAQEDILLRYFANCCESYLYGIF